jgi:hypothetical protein
MFRERRARLISREKLTVAGWSRLRYVYLPVLPRRSSFHNVALLEEFRQCSGSLTHKSRPLHSSRHIVKTERFAD